MARDHDDDPLIDANDLMWGLFLGAPTVLVATVLTDYLPFWGLLLVSAAVGLAMTPLHRRYERRQEARRPSNRGIDGR